jgi:hypothetical protein
MKRRQTSRSPAQIAADAKRTGRPSLGRDAKQHSLVIRLKEIEYQRFRKAAKNSSVSMATIIMAPHRNGKE